MSENQTIYLDNAGTSFPKPPVVYQAMEQFLRTLGANPGRGGHAMAVGAEGEIDRTRSGLARLFSIRDHQRLIFTLNCTDALNIAMKGHLRDGDHVITTVLEHNSVSRPLEQMAQNGMITLTRLPCSEDGYLDPDEVKNAIRPETRLVVMTHASNVLGTVQPIREVGALVKESKASFLVDAAQTAGVVPVDVEADHIDLLAFPGHKALYGPPGSGGLYVAPEIQLHPWREGGTGGDSATPTQPTEYPYYLEGGTPNTVGIAGLGAGVRFVEETGMEKIHAHEQHLRKKLVEAFKDDDRCRVYGPKGGQPTVAPLSLGFADLPSDEVAGILDQSFQVAVRSGMHCAPYIHRHLGTFPAGTARFSPGFFNTENDIEHAISALQEILEQVAS
jgi:cysteine desulfurase family protein